MPISPAASTTTAPALYPHNEGTRLRAPRGGLVVGDRHYRGGVYLPAAARPILEAAARKAYQAARVEPTILGIAGFSYAVQPIVVAASIGTVAYSLADLDRNRLHHVHRDLAGEVRCDCGDYQFRRCGTGQPCKHSRRLVELGLIPSTVPAVLPPFARRIEGSQAAQMPQGEAFPAIAVSPSIDGIAHNWASEASRVIRRPRFEPTQADIQAAAELLGWR